MKLVSNVVTGAVLMAALAAPAFCQKPSPFPAPVPDSSDAIADEAARMEVRARKMAIDAQSLSLDRMEALADRADQLSQQLDSAKMADLTAKASAMADKFNLTPDFDLNLSQLKMQFDSTGIKDMTDAAADLANQVKMSFLQAPAPLAAPAAPRAPKIQFRSRDAYNEGTRDLDEHKYDEAVQRFDNAIAQDPAHAEGALYWKAYALNRQGKRDEALAAIAQLRRDYASSAWLHDAEALEAEVKQSNGQPVSPSQESNEDLKLLAINSLMNADAERAIPLVEGILRGSSGPNVKNNALFVISQSKSPRAQQVLLEYAKGAGNPDLQLRAIQYVGMSRTKEAQQQLAAIYAGASDARVKNAIVQVLTMARATDALMNIARTEKDPTLRGSAIRELASNKTVPVEGLLELYGSSDASSKREIINGLRARGDAKTLVDLARKETDPALKRLIVEHLGGMHDNKDAMDYMMELLK